MSFDFTEPLIREAVAAEADRAPHPQAVLDELHRRAGRVSRRRGPLFAVAAAVVVIAAVAGVIVPRLSHRGATTGPATGAAAPISQNVLLVGVDDNGYADSIVLAHLGENGTGDLVSLPRDSWVDIPGSGEDKLNAAYRLGGIDKLVATVGELTGAHIDHYATVEMAAFGRLSTAAGGVPVCLRWPVHDGFSGASFPAGEQTLTGPSALAFLRQRHGLPNGDLDRVVRLQAFLASLARRLTGSPALNDPQALNALLTVVRENVRVDPGWDLLAFAGQLHGLRTDQLRAATIPITGSAMRGPGRVDAIGVDPAQVRSFVQGLIAGTAPAPTTPPETGSAPPSGKDGCVN
ncbi:MAG TPA: LCP family protein [Amycolatopsis sp.]|uniref:LCP family protein n=1 Tax=Amycolatopsis sp. TaxID=37632 RepID=UPI002B47C3BB|nr:LCP family protein [Amycolatopsis sp.]HKS49606.1 LCP family protein [Amycolatopsis sp.]